MNSIAPWPLQDATNTSWAHYLNGHADASVYFDPLFGRAVKRAYNLTEHYLIAGAPEKPTGVLPLFAVGGLLSRPSLVSLPFCDYGGMLADNEQSALSLAEQAVAVANRTHCNTIELRQTYDLQNRYPSLLNKIRDLGWHTSVATSKVQMFLALPGNADQLFASFPAKLRSQIRKPQKDGCTCSQGGVELLDDFYHVWATNMRFLGSPVHSRALMSALIEGDPARSRIFVVYIGRRPIAASLVLGFGSTLVNPWASFIKEFRQNAPNMMLYWEMLQYAIAQRYTCFDFGRSTQGEGTYNFKAQWGAHPHQLYWYTFSRHPQKESADHGPSALRALFIRVWQKLPLKVTLIVGPPLRKQISL